MSDKRLGKGLGALIRPITEKKQLEPKNVESIPIKSIKENPHQPRKIFDPKKLEEMVNSIRAKGIITPITVQEDNGSFILIAGERRLRAAKLAKLKMIPAFRMKVKNESELLEIALIENIQRENLNAIEEAEAFALLQSQFNLNHTEIAKAVGKKRVTVSNSIRLLSLPKEILESIRKNEVSAGHGRGILMEKTNREKLKLWEKIKRERLSVRAVEQWIKDKSAGTKTSADVKQPQKYVAAIRAIENEIIELLGTKVKLKPEKEGGVISVHYFSNEDLERILELLRSMD